MKKTLATAPLRQLAVFVNEAEPGAFCWVVMEAQKNFKAWRTVESSTERFASWIDAYDAGDDALISMIPDIQNGPRLYGKQQNQNIEAQGRR